jgi:EAL domain-containing protein (putative c-di-GMP-specific phosphodiesterase class I)
MGTRAVRRLDLENGLRRAIDRQEFQLHYQPIVRLETGRIVGMEVLIRWRHPTDGLLPPAEFIPLAEERNLIVTIGRWTMEEACRQARCWQEQYDSSTPLFLSINMSARQLQQPHLVEELDEILQHAGLEPACLALEITERIVTEDNPPLRAVLRDLKVLGVKLAIDDFGTGQSSLAALKFCPVDFVKIDQAFIAGLRRGSHDTVIVAGITGLAHALGMKVIAEGIEDAEQRARLRTLGSDLGQGFFFTKPLPADAAGRLLISDTLGAVDHGGRFEGDIDQKTGASDTLLHPQ